MNYTDIREVTISIKRCDVFNGEYDHEKEKWYSTEKIGEEYQSRIEVGGLVARISSRLIESEDGMPELHQIAQDSISALKSISIEARA